MKRTTLDCQNNLDSISAFSIGQAVSANINLSSVAAYTGVLVSTHADASNLVFDQSSKMSTQLGKTHSRKVQLEIKAKKITNSLANCISKEYMNMSSIIFEDVEIASELLTKVLVLDDGDLSTAWNKMQHGTVFLDSSQDLHLPSLMFEEEASFADLNLNDDRIRDSVRMSQRNIIAGTVKLSDLTVEKTVEATGSAFSAMVNLNDNQIDLNPSVEFKKIEIEMFATADSLLDSFEVDAKYLDTRSNLHMKNLIVSEVASRVVADSCNVDDSSYGMNLTKLLVRLDKASLPISATFSAPETTMKSDLVADTVLNLSLADSLLFTNKEQVFSAEQSFSEAYFNEVEAERVDSISLDKIMTLNTNQSLSDLYILNGSDFDSISSAKIDTLGFDVFSNHKSTMMREIEFIRNVLEGNFTGDVKVTGNLSFNDTFQHDFVIPEQASVDLLGSKRFTQPVTMNSICRAASNNEIDFSNLASTEAETISSDIEFSRTSFNNVSAARKSEEDALTLLMMAADHEAIDLKNVSLIMSEVVRVENSKVDQLLRNLVTKQGKQVVDCFSKFSNLTTFDSLTVDSTELESGLLCDLDVDVLKTIGKGRIRLTASESYSESVDLVQCETNALLSPSIEVSEDIHFNLSEISKNMMSVLDQLEVDKYIKFSDEVHIFRPIKSNQGQISNGLFSLLRKRGETTIIMTGITVGDAFHGSSGMFNGLNIRKLRDQSVIRGDFVFLNGFVKFAAGLTVIGNLNVNSVSLLPKADMSLRSSLLLHGNLSHASNYIFDHVKFARGIKLDKLPPVTQSDPTDTSCNEADYEVHVIVSRPATFDQQLIINKLNWEPLHDLANIQTTSNNLNLSDSHWLSAVKTTDLFSETTIHRSPPLAEVEDLASVNVSVTFGGNVSVDVCSFTRDVLHIDRNSNDDPGLKPTIEVIRRDTNESSSPLNVVSVNAALHFDFINVTRFLLHERELSTEDFVIVSNSQPLDGDMTSNWQITGNISVDKMVVGENLVLMNNVSLDTDWIYVDKWQIADKSGKIELINNQVEQLENSVQQMNESLGGHDDSKIYSFGLQNNRSQCTPYFM
ncbi:hypothetical protein HDE_09383 [Halotydeus destructor]|nr:hypothetical protein HDE_09383 [Halotydeus destructor]